MAAILSTTDDSAPACREAATTNRCRPRSATAGVAVAAGAMALALAAGGSGAASPAAQGPVPGDATAPDTVVTRPQDTLWALSRRVSTGRDGGRVAWMVALRRANPDAFVDGNLHRLRPGATLVLPTAAAVAAEDTAAADALVRLHRAWIDEGRSGPAPFPAAAPGREPQAGVADAPRAPSAPPPRTAVPARTATDALSTATKAASTSPATAAPLASAQVAPPPPSPAATTIVSRTLAGVLAAAMIALALALALALAVALGVARRIAGRRRAGGPSLAPVRSGRHVDRGPLRGPHGPTRPAGGRVGPALDGLPPSPASVADGDPARPGSGTPDPHLAALQLAVARAQAELGRTAEARRTAEAVARRGDPALGASARALLAALPSAG